MVPSRGEPRSYMLRSQVGTTLPQQVVTLKKKSVDGFPSAQFYPAGKFLDLCFFCNSIRTISNKHWRSPSEKGESSLMWTWIRWWRRWPQGCVPWTLSMAWRGTGPFGDSLSPSLCPPRWTRPCWGARHAESQPQLRCIKTYPGAPGAARSPFHTTPCGWPGSSGLELQCHPHGARRQGAPLYGLALWPSSSISQVSKPRAFSLGAAPTPRCGHRGQRGVCVLPPPPLHREGRGWRPVTSPELPNYWIQIALPATDHKLQRWTHLLAWVGTWSPTHGLIWPVAVLIIDTIFLWIS